MERELIEPEELRARLDRELRRRSGDEDCTFEGEIERLEQPSPSGCNWSADHLTIPEECAEAAAEVLAEAIRRYNLR